MSWTPEKVEKLKELWGKGNTASEIAQILGGVTRNAVIGKAHRLNLSGKIQTKKISSLTANNNNNTGMYEYLLHIIIIKALIMARRLSDDFEALSRDV